MSRTKDNPASRRDVFLHIALAVAEQGLPEPQGLDFHREIPLVTVDFDRWAHATVWAEWLGALDTARWQDHPDHGLRGLYYHGARYGLSWTFNGVESVDPPESEGLAAKVVAAILTPDAAVSS